jgi:hypothetical protein
VFEGQALIRMFKKGLENSRRVNDMWRGAAKLLARLLPQGTVDVCMTFYEDNCALQTRSDFCNARNETARPQSQFPNSCFCERFKRPLS